MTSGWLLYYNSLMPEPSISVRHVCTKPVVLEVFMHLQRWWCGSTGVLDGKTIGIVDVVDGWISIVSRQSTSKLGPPNCIDALGLTQSHLRSTWDVQSDQSFLETEGSTQTWLSCNWYRSMTTLQECEDCCWGYFSYTITQQHIYTYEPRATSSAHHAGRVSIWPLHQTLLAI